MLETLAFGAVVAIVLLGLDLGLRRGIRQADGETAAARLLLTARLVALLLLAAALTTNCRSGDGGSFAADLGWTALFGCAGLLALELALLAGLWPLGRIVADARAGNLAAATAVAAHTVAVGILVANVTGGHSFAELGIAVVAYAIGQGSLFVLLVLFRALTTYDDKATLAAGNQAAAFAHGGLTLALALLIAHASDGEFVGLWPALRDYGTALAEGLAVYPLRQLLVQCLILRGRPTFVGGELDRAIGERGDLGAGLLEGGTYLAMALFVVRLA